MNIGIADIVTAHLFKTVGSKIIDPIFWNILEEAIANFEFPENGQGYIELPAARQYVSGGVACRKDIPLSGYHVVPYREGPALFVDRQYAAPVENLACVVYTGAAYQIDPDCTPVEKERTKDYTHVLVAVLASAGPKPSLSAFRFCHNLAGGNNAYKPENGYTLEKAIEECKKIVTHQNEWITVADRAEGAEGITSNA